MTIDVLERGGLPFPRSLPEFRHMLLRRRRRARPVLNASAGATSLSVLITAHSARHTVSPRARMYCVARRGAAIRVLPPAPSWSARTTLLSVWFWVAYLVAGQTPGISAVHFQRQLGLSCCVAAFQILHRLRVGIAGDVTAPSYADLYTAKS